MFEDNFTDFVECAHQTAREVRFIIAYNDRACRVLVCTLSAIPACPYSQFSTSFYGAALHGTSYEIETAMNFVNAQSTDPLDPNCWIATQVDAAGRRGDRLRPRL